LGDSKFRDSIAATGAWFIFGLFLNSIQGSGWELQGFALSTLTTLFSVLFMERHAILSRRQLLHLHLLHLYFRIQFGKSRHRAPLTSTGRRPWWSGWCRSSWRWCPPERPGCSHYATAAAAVATSRSSVAVVSVDRED